MKRTFQIINAAAAAVALAASIGCLWQVHELSERVNAMASAVTAMRGDLAAAACRDCRTRLAAEVRR